METSDGEQVDALDTVKTEEDAEVIVMPTDETVETSDIGNIRISDVKTVETSAENDAEANEEVPQDDDASTSQVDNVTLEQGDDEALSQDDNAASKQTDDDKSKQDDDAVKEDDGATSEQEQPEEKKQHLQRALNLIEVGSDLLEVIGEADAWRNEVITVTDMEGKSHELPMKDLAAFEHQPKMLKCTHCHYEVRYLPHKVEQMKRHVTSDDHQERKSRNLDKDKKKGSAVKRINVRNISVLKPEASADSLPRLQSPYKKKDEKSTASSTLIMSLPKCSVALTKIDKDGKVTIVGTDGSEKVSAGKIIKTQVTKLDPPKQKAAHAKRVQVVKMASVKPKTPRGTRPQATSVSTKQPTSSQRGKQSVMGYEEITIEIDGQECVLQLTPSNKQGKYKATATPKVELQEGRATPGGRRSSGAIASTSKSSKGKKITIIPIDKILPAHAQLAAGKAKDTQSALSAALDSMIDGKSTRVMHTKSSSSPHRSVVRVGTTRDPSDDSPRYIIPPKTGERGRPRAPYYCGSGGSAERLEGRGPYRQRPPPSKSQEEQTSGKKSLLKQQQYQMLAKPRERMVAVNKLSEDDILKLLKYSDQSAAAKECKAKYVLMHCSTPLPVNVTYSLLCWDNKPDDRVATSIRYKPNAGEVLLYDTHGLKFDVKADGYINSRTTQMTHYGHMITTYYVLKQNASMAAQADGKDWVRSVTVLRHDKHYALVQYVIQNFVKPGDEVAARVKVEATTDSSATTTTSPATAATSAAASASATSADDTGDTSTVNDALSILENMIEPRGENDAQQGEKGKNTEQTEGGKPTEREGDSAVEGESVSTAPEEVVVSTEQEEVVISTTEGEGDSSATQAEGEGPGKGEGVDDLSMKEVGDLMKDLQEITTEDLVNLLSQDANTMQEPEMVAIPVRPKAKSTTPRPRHVSSIAVAGVKRAADEMEQDHSYDPVLDREMRAKRLERDEATNVLSVASGPFTQVERILNRLQDATDDGEGVVLFKYDGILPADSAKAILEWEDKKRVSSSVRFRPSGGEVFLYDSQLSSHPQDWKADGYTWRNRGRKNNGKIYANDYAITYRMHEIEPDDYERRFRRKVYNLVNDARYTLVQYVGDETLAVPAPHGTTVTKPSAHYRRTPMAAVAAKHAKLDTGDDDDADNDKENDADEQATNSTNASSPARSGLSYIQTLTPTFDDDYLNDLVTSNAPTPDDPNAAQTPAESEGSVVLMKQEELLSYELAHALVMWSTKQHVATKCVSNTQHGDVVLYDTRRQKQPWMHDGMKWVSTDIRNHKYCQRVEYSSGFRDQLFKRYVYTVPSLAAYAVVQYIGDHNAAIVDKLQYETPKAKDAATKYKGNNAAQSMTDRSFRLATMERKQELIAEALSAPPPYDDTAIMALIDTDKYPLHEVDTGAGIVMFSYETKLEMPMVHSILRMANKVRVSTHPVFQPKGGDVILYNSRDNPTDWKADGYVWKNYGTHGCTLGIKSHFAIATGIHTKDKGFKRHAAKLHHNNDYTIVQYIGNEKLYKPRPHGNCKKTTDTYYRARPSFVKKAKEKLHDKTAPNAYKELANEDTPRRAGSMYKMLFRIKKEIMRKERMFTDEDKNNVLQLAKDMDGGFIHRVLLHPGFTVVCAMLQILQVVDTFFGQAEEDPLVFAYETTHDISRLYSVSIVSVHHSICTEGTIVPVAMVMHTQPFAQVFKEVLFSLSDNMSNLHNSRFVFIIDRDDLIHSSLAKIAPRAHPVHCWEKMKRDFEKEKGITRKERSRLRRDLERILKTEDNEELLQTYEQLRYTWSKDRRDYFTKYLLPYIRVYSSRPLLQDLGLYQHPIGITNPRCQAWLTAAKPVADLSSVEPVQLIEVFYNVQAKIVNMENYSKPLPMRKQDTATAKTPNMVYEQHAAAPQQQALAATHEQQQLQQQQQQQTYDERPNIRTPVEVKKEKHDEVIEYQQHQQQYVQTHVADGSTLDQGQLAEVELVPTTDHETEIAVEYLDMAEEVTLSR